MNPTKVTTRALAIAAFALTAISSGCTSQQIAQYAASQENAKAALATQRSQHSLTDAQLARLAKCESGGNPHARSRSGKYTGLYQFDQRTWDSVARNVLPSYVGVTPGDAPSWVQDAMARALYAQRGRSPWPVCGRQI